jgi:8-oxo-dGTP pyrophosphatase MutT (NUDIX family)
VAVIVVDEPHPQVVLTLRSSRLRAHAGQWALPGGRLRPGEEPLEGACREAFEEVGVPLGPEHLLGRLDDYRTRSGFVISPFVFAVTGQVEWNAQVSEVEELHLVPMETLDVDPEFADYGAGQDCVLRIPFGDRFIHAPTGAILFQFREVGLHGRWARLEDVQEPVFAWA